MTSNSEPFSLELRRRTGRAHRLAEQARFIRNFLRGTLDRAAYIGLLQRLHGLYEVLERELEHHQHTPGVAPFWLPELARTAALAADLQALGGRARAGNGSPATHRYRERLATCGREDPLRLVSHAYVRYLGDLSGGRLLHRLAVRSLDLQPGAGDAFYTFPQVPDLQRAKQDFRAQLDALGEAYPARRDDLAEEAILAFRLNIDLFNELDPAPWTRLWRAFGPRRAAAG